MKLIQRTENIFEISMGFVKAFLIRGNGELALIDTGIPGQETAILDAIEGAGMSSSDLKHILITHLHFDHVGSLNRLKELTGALVYAHEDEAEDLEEGVTMRESKPSPPLLSRIIIPLISGKRAEKRIPGTGIDKKLKDGEEIDIAGGITALHTPGHTRGHLSFLLKEGGGVLIAGDAASGGKHPGYPLLFENVANGIKTLHELGNMSFEKAFFAHGKGITSGAAYKFSKRF